MPVGDEVIKSSLGQIKHEFVGGFKNGEFVEKVKSSLGHGKFETLGALGIYCMLLGTAGGNPWHALDILMGLYSANPEVVGHSLTHHNHHHSGHHREVDMEHPSLSLSMTVLSIAVKEGLYEIIKRAAEKQGSGLMKANAWHHHADAISSVVALTLMFLYTSPLGLSF